MIEYKGCTVVSGFSLEKKEKNIKDSPYEMLLDKVNNDKNKEATHARK